MRSFFCSKWGGSTINQLPALTLTASLPLKLDGWKTNFLLGKSYFRGELLVLGRVVCHVFVYPPNKPHEDSRFQDVLQLLDCFFMPGPITASFRKRVHSWVSDRVGEPHCFIRNLPGPNPWIPRDFFSHGFFFSGHKRAMISKK